MNRQLALFVTAMQFLTRLPTPPLGRFEPAWAARSARYFPLVGFLVGAIGAGVWWLASLCLPGALAVGLGLTATVLATGALHEDGFADACDGFGGGTSPERVLAIMRDSRIGAFGAVGLVLLLGLKWVSLDALAGAALFAPVVIGSHVVSRSCAAALLWMLPYVRLEDDAKSRATAAGADARDWGIGGAIAALLLVPLAAACAHAAGGIGAVALLAGVLGAAAATALAAVYFRRRIGGQTGDCLGAAQQLSELCFLMTALAAVHP